jgi:hypothetical protein
MRPEDAFAHTGVARPPLPRRSLRLWSVRHACGLAAFYRRFEGLLRALHPLFARIGYARLERPVATVERAVKSTLFDCRMCGQCVLSATGLSCPMNCPKGLRNGPCGGVRDDGHCEVHPAMPCVWVQAYAGAERMGTVARLGAVQPPVDHRRAGRSSWLRAAQGHAAS